MLKKTESELQDKVLADYKAVLGKVFLTKHLSGYNKDTDDEIEVYPADGILVRVIETPIDDLFNWNSSFIDPYYNVEPIDQNDLRSCWVDGPSYMTDGHQQDGDLISVTLSEKEQKLVDALVSFIVGTEEFRRRWDETKVWHEPEFRLGRIYTDTGTCADLSRAHKQANMALKTVYCSPQICLNCSGD